MPKAGIASVTNTLNMLLLPPLIASSIWWMLMPPIQVLSPNQAHATSARVSEGRLAPCRHMTRQCTQHGTAQHVVW